MKLKVRNYFSKNIKNMKLMSNEYAKIMASHMKNLKNYIKGLEQC